MGKIKKEQVKRFFFSLCISIFVWGYVTNMHNPVQTKTLSNVPVEIENLEVLESQNLAIDYNTQVTTSVVVEGRYSDIQNISTKDISAKLDLSDLALKEGSNTIVLDIKPTNTSIRIVKEKTLFQVKLDIVKLLQKEIPVIVNSVGSLEDNYISGEVELSKEKVIVSGTKESLDEIKYALAIIDFDSASKDIETKVKLKAVNKVGDVASNIVMKDKEIDLFVPIYYSKEVPVEIKFKNNIPNGYKVEKYSLNYSSITIVGDKEVLDKVSSISTEEISLYNKYSDFDKRIQLVLPDGVKTKNNITSVYGSFYIKK